MEGVTDYVFREMIARIAPPEVMFTEFTNTEALFSKGYAHTIPRFRFSDKQRPVIAQIWGTDLKNFFRAARLIKELGFDGIDINMGCPDRSVVKLGCGAALINNQPLAAAMIAAVRDGAPGLPVSVKTRLGIKSLTTEPWIRFLLEQHPDAITIHGRTAKELSRVPVHWDEIGKAVKLRDRYSPSTVIVGNGGILSRKQAKSIHEMYGVDGVMIGTGIFENPWVFEETPKEHTNKELLSLLLLHTRRYADCYPGERRFTAMRKYFKIYVHSFSGAATLMKQLMSTTNYAEVELCVRAYLK
jgi:tRNA-dihydrouridine synthase